MLFEEEILSFYFIQTTEYKRITKLNQGDYNEDCQIVFILTLLAFCRSIIAGEQIISVYNRDKTSLNGNWKMMN